MKHDKAFAQEAVMMVAEYLQSIRLSPYRFSSQIALCQLLQLADEEPTSEVAHWILSAPREQLWKRDAAGMFTEGDEPTHVLFRQAWQDFLSNELPEM